MSFPLARPPLSASAMSVAVLSSDMHCSALAFHPCQNFVLVLRVRSYTQETGTRSSSATSCTVSRVCFSRVAPPVASFAGSPRVGSNVLTDGDAHGNCGGVSGKFPGRLSNRDGNGLIAGRGACCRDDAVFSRASNWRRRDFMLASQCPWAFLLRCSGYGCGGLARACTQRPF